jgi:hypothetical protein
MTTIEIVLGEKQLTLIQEQVASLITTEIEKAKRENTNFLRYMNKAQTCEYLQISRWTLEHWIKEGLPIIKINKSTRIDKFAIDDWLTTK